MADFYMGPGDKLWRLTLSLTDPAGAAQNLTGCTVRLKLWKTGVPGVLVVDQPMTIPAPATNGKVEYLFTDADHIAIGAVPALLEGYARVVDGASLPGHAPADRRFTVYVSDV